MSETTGMELILPHSGELIDPADVQRVADVYAEVQALEGDLNRARRALADVLLEHSETIGAKTFTIGARRVEIQGGSRTTYDGPALADELRVAGMPEAAIDEIVTTEITVKVDARRLKQAARANEKYAEAMERHADTTRTTPRVTVT